MKTLQLNAIGDDKERIRRLLDTQKSFHKYSDVKDSNLAYNVWIGDSAPPFGIHTWYRSHRGESAWNEIKKARKEREAYNLDFIVIHHITNTPHSSTLHICVGRDKIIRAFYNEIDVDKFTLDIVAHRI